jgi:hypothetical protein
MPANTVAPTSILQTYDGRLFGRSVANDLIPAPGRPFNMNCAVAAGASTGIVLVTMQVVDRDGNAVAADTPYHFDWYLSDDTTHGVGLTATTASGAVGASGSNGVDLGVLTAKKATRSQTDANGIYQASITDSAKTAFVVCASFPMGFHKPNQILATLASSDYHA